MELDGITEFLARTVPHMRDLLIAFVLAFAIGWNRERAGEGAGMRTFPLVAVASCGFMLAAEGLGGDDPEAMARVLTGVITGIGFIGGGAILKGGSEVHGTATAASLWATGALGASVALDAYHIAAMIALFTVATLYVLTPLKPRADK